jgi:cytochrome c oxidase assembly protein subunit 15
MQIANCKLQIENCETETSPWPRRWALVLACATFPLVWVGGLVTTTDAGMAVPDWPSTYGYNLFLYPWQTWLAGPWDIFVEHGHRLLGAAVGLITIALLAVLWRSDDRVWLRWLGLAALALVIFQGVLGGMRVLFDERTLAMFHGTTGPLFFGLTVAMVVFTSRRWRQDSPPFQRVADQSSPPFQGVANQAFPPFQGGARGGFSPASAPWARQISLLAIVACVLVYLQIVLGAVLRHVPIDSEPATFALAVRFHLFLAAVLSLHIVVLARSVLQQARHTKPLGALAWLLVGLLTAQLALGAGTWVVRFAAPAWAPQWLAFGRAAVQEGGWLQTHVITAHVAVGSLLFAAVLALALFAVRLLAAPLPAHRVRVAKMEAAL